MWYCVCVCVWFVKKLGLQRKPGVFIVTQFAAFACESAVQVEYNRENFCFGNIIKEETLQKVL